MNSDLNKKIRSALNAHPRLALTVFKTLKSESRDLPSLAEWYMRFDSVRVGRMPRPSTAQSEALEYQPLPQGSKDAWGFFTAL